MRKKRVKEKQPLISTSQRVKTSTKNQTKLEEIPKNKILETKRF